MPEVNTQDEVVNARTNARSLSARPVEEESVSASSGAVQVSRNGIEDDTHGLGGRRTRTFKESVTKRLDQIEAEEREPTPHDEGDADEDEPVEDAVTDGDEVADASDEGDADEGEEESESEEESEEAPNEWQTKAQTLEQRNRELIGELEVARKTPKTQRTERETALIAAEASYIDEGSVPALRKFLAIIVGAAPDSKEVDAELAGVYTDLTARELGVTLDQNQQALRDNARTRLLLARDKREKADADKKPTVDNSADDVDYGAATQYLDNLFSTKNQSGTSLADEYPMLMDLATDFDGYKPTEVIARAIRREIMTGTLDPRAEAVDMVRAVAPKIEKYYDAVAKKIEAARAKKNKKPSTTTTSGKPKVAIEASTEQRQSPGARTLTNATASRAPAKPPKTPTKPKAPTTEKKTRKDFPTNEAWKQHLLDLHSS